MSIADLREEYRRHSLDESHVLGDPMDQFRLWFEEARRVDIREPNAMALATCDHQGNPSVRILLLKAADQRGFTFFTNYESRKGKELELNPKASMVFFWNELERQVRIEGPVEKISREESQSYYDSRPIGSRLGAWASEQSQKISGRHELESRMEELKKQYELENPTIPPHWGGYLLRPLNIEFWQGRPSRLHDRICFSRKNTETAEWEMFRLAP